MEIRLAHREVPEAAAVAAPRSAETRAEAMAWDRLRARGWRVDQAQDGSILLFPPPARSPAASMATEVEQPSAPTQPEKATSIEPPSASPAPRDWDITAHPRARGWHAEREEDGSLLVYPLGWHDARTDPAGPR